VTHGDRREEIVAKMNARPLLREELRTGERGYPPPVHRSSDIPIDVIERTYTPPLTSSKASFRSDGSDHERDQDFITRAADDRWNDEDRLTNKSGDPRIGTHGRKRDRDETRH
jgi:hypothetical protein